MEDAHDVTTSTPRAVDGPCASTPSRRRSRTMAAGTAGRRRRRRGPRERGRPHLRGAAREPGARRLHGPLHVSGFICVPMPRRDARPARPAADDRWSTRTARAPRTPSRSTPATACPPASRPRTARARSRCSPTPPPSRRSSRARATSSRCAPCEGGVLRRPGHTEAAVDLARLAGLTPAGALCEMVNDDGSMMRAPELPRVRRRARAGDDLDRRPDRPHAGTPRARSTGRRRPGAHGVRRVPGRRLPVDGSTASSTSRWSTATSATATTSWSASTRSASPATCSARCAATAARSCRPR